tara:strand:+ start:16108 stop:16374 length:267 start_codon:yes stop_codon:yes gene_type:complete
MTKKIQYKTKEQRKEDVRNIIKELNKFELTLRYEPVKKLYAHFKDFIENGNIVKVNIPFPMINRRIKGNLMPNVKADSVITLVKERFN